MSEHGSAGPLEPSSSDIEDVERTPRDQQAQGPPSEQDCAPRGPPPPMPVNARGHVERFVPSTAAAHPERASADEADSHDGAAAAGPGPCRRRPREPSSSSFADEDEDDEEGEEEEDGNGNEHAEDEGYWSDTSLVLEGPALETACDAFVLLFRRQLTELHGDLSSRSVAARVGALRRRLRQSHWSQVQGLASQRLEGRYLREWTEAESSSRMNTTPDDSS